MPSETIKLTAKFKLKETPKGLDGLFLTYREIVNFLISYAFENNITLSLPNSEFVQIITHEREIRTGYFVKRRKIQKKLRSGKRRKELLEKYGQRERNRLNDLYHKLANKIVELAEKYGGIALEDLTEIRRFNKVFG